MCLFINGWKRIPGIFSHGSFSHGSFFHEHAWEEKSEASVLRTFLQLETKYKKRRKIIPDCQKTMQILQSSIVINIFCTPCHPAV